MLSLPRKVLASPAQEPLWWFCLTVSLVLVLWITLTPQESERQTNLVPLAASSQLFYSILRSAEPLAHQALPYLLLQVGGNVAAFVPIGLCLAALLRVERPGRTLVAATMGGSMLSLAIEIVQLSLPTRATDVDDLIFNSLGAAGGAGVWMLMSRSRRTSPGGVGTR